MVLDEGDAGRDRIVGMAGGNDDPGVSDNDLVVGAADHVKIISRRVDQRISAAVTESWAPDEAASKTISILLILAAFAVRFKV